MTALNNLAGSHADYRREDYIAARTQKRYGLDLEHSAPIRPLWQDYAALVGVSLFIISVLAIGRFA